MQLFKQFLRKIEDQVTVSSPNPISMAFIMETLKGLKIQL